MNFKKNLIDLISDAHFYQYAGINDTKKNCVKKRPLLFFTRIQWLLIIIAILVSIFIKKGFSDEFAGYIISGLSLFVGLFFTFLITLYDKFKSIDFSQYHKSVNENNNKIGIKLKNFFTKISVLTLYSVLISIISILLLSVTLLFSEINYTIDFCYFLQAIKQKEIYDILKTIFVFSYRVVTLYFLLDFLLITIYINSSFYDFIISEYNKVKLS
jgi:hypothetical protein